MNDRSIEILLVDDSQEDRSFVRKLLQKGFPGKHRISCTRSLEEALNYLDWNHVDLVLLDLMLPDSSGVDTLTSIRGRDNQVPVVVLSGNGKRELALEALRLGAQDYFLKQRLNSDALARVVQFAIERQRRIIAEQELLAAEQVQSRLFPVDPPPTAELDIAGAALSAGKGCGDYYDFLNLPSGELGLVVGDVSGHGMAAALRMVETRAYLRSLACQMSDPGEIVTKLNQYMLRESAYGVTEVEQFVTLFFAAINIEERTLRFAGAGHVAHLVAADAQVLRLDSTGPALGIIDASVDTSEWIQIKPGDTLVVATDGFEEAMSPAGELFGKKRLLDFVIRSRPQRASQIIKGLFATTRQFTQQSAPRDDVTLIIVNVLDSVVSDPDESTTIHQHASAPIDRRAPRPRRERLCGSAFGT